MQAISHLGSLNTEGGTVTASGSRDGRVSGPVFCLFGHIQKQL